MLNGRNGILSSHLSFGDHRRGWDFVSPGPRRRAVRARLPRAQRRRLQGPLSIEWEDNGMNREQGAPEALGAWCAAWI